MSRIVRHDARGPVEVKVGEQSVWVCQCGLSGKKPLCDGTHKRTAATEDEGKTYAYDKKGNRVEVENEY